MGSSWRGPTTTHRRASNTKRKLRNFPKYSTQAGAAQPGLDVLQIKRSKGVKHYVHLVHSIADIGTYKRYSFDYFDTVLTSNSYQIAALRELEKLRGTPEKALLETGCVYMDRLEARVASEGATPAPAAEPCVLVAASWGANGLLSRYGTKLLKPLLDAGLEVIIRPHPQSYISEKPMLEALSDELVAPTKNNQMRWMRMVL